MKYTIIVDVDEDKVKKAAGTDNAEEAVRTEAGWMAESGIQVLSVERASTHYVLTEQGKKKCELYIANAKAKRKEVLDAGLDTADSTNIPSVQAIEQDIAFMGIDDTGEYYNAWGVTDNYNTDEPITLQLGYDFYEVEDAA